MKRCKKCLELKSYDSFYVHPTNIDGLFGKCKECVALDKQKYQKANKDHISAVARVRYQNKKEQILKYNRKYYHINKQTILPKIKNYYNENKERLSQCRKKYLASTHGKKKHVEHALNHKAKHPERYNARQMVRSAIKSGKLNRGDCSECGATHRIEAHHFDYGKPLDVVWLCIPCHKKLHNSIGVV